MSKNIGMTTSERLYPPLQSFAVALTEKFSAQARGEPEDQLKAPVDRLFAAFSEATGNKIVLKGESRLQGRLGRPDFAVLNGKLPVGYIELKAPGKGANPELFKGHDLDQWKRFKNVPNLLYTDGNEWALFQNGELAEKRIRIEGDIRTDGKKAVTESNAKALFSVIARFTSWAPIVPVKPKPLAEFLAPYCRLLRDEVIDALGDAKSPMHSLKREIKKLLFPDADDDRFADSYAQTVIFALLLAHIEEADVLDLNDAYNKLAAHHLLLSRSLQFLTDPSALEEISSSLSLAQRIIHEIPAETLKAKSEKDDPWLYFYENFLAGYDPKLRKEAGVYFTPMEVVRCQVRLIDEILQKHLGKPMGFVEPGVTTLDPAAGTGTYLLGIIDHTLARVEEEEGPGAVKGGARSLARSLYGFEWMVGPYAVAQLRFSRALTSRGSTLPARGPGIYLTNTLESPHKQPSSPPLFHKPIADEHESALTIKDSEHVLVILGNPPYGRHEAVTEYNHAVTGGWVRHDDSNDPMTHPILEDFLKPARDAGFGVHLKNLYNLYNYFIRWSLWKVFEHKTATGPGVVSFITASSYIDGDAFVGVREHMRRVCDHIDIIDLGGEGRGTRKDENVFAIQTPVCIFVAWREGAPQTDTPAEVRYTRIEGTRDEKLIALDEVRKTNNLKWRTAPKDWQSSFRPERKTVFSSWPDIADLFPWQQSGVEVKRSWPIGSDAHLLLRRWTTLVKEEDVRKKVAFKETRDRKIDKEYHDIISGQLLKPIINAELCDMKEPVPYSFRFLDRQWLIPDTRIADYLRPVLWRNHGEHQIYFASLFNHPLGSGQALVVSANIPDRHHFRGSYGGKDILPLYRDASGLTPNVLATSLFKLSTVLGKDVSAEDLAGYVYAILAQPLYTIRFSAEIESRKLKVPLTKDAGIFFEAAEVGKQMIWTHTFGERFANKDRPKGEVQKGNARCTKAVPDQEAEYPNNFEYDEDRKALCVGEGEFAPVSPEVYNFEVSGLKVVRSWLGYRMRERSGRKSSPLDDIRPKIWTHEFTRELLELLWVLETTIAGYPAQEKLFERVLESDLFLAKDLPPVPVDMRKPPRVVKKDGKQIDNGV